MRVVCFDLGGVLVRICRSWAEATESAGVPLKQPEQLLSEAWRLRRWALVDRYQRGQLQCDDYFAGMAEAVEGLYDPSEIRRIHDAWTLQEYDGIAELVEQLAQVRDLVTACLSNTNHAHWVRLNGEREPLEYPSVSKLTHRLASHQLGLAKPDAEIYQRACEHFACAPSDILFFDDLQENVNAAREQGWNAELIDHTGDTAAQMRSHLARHGIVLD